MYLTLSQGLKSDFILFLIYQSKILTHSELLRYSASF
nr:MAG TPA: hypothetical protein [Caudoviricetes sp.]